MKKGLVGLAVIAVLGVGGYFGYLDREQSDPKMIRSNYK